MEYEDDIEDEMEKKERKVIHRLIEWTQRLSDKSEDEELEYTRRDLLWTGAFVVSFVVVAIVLVLLFFR